MVSYEKGGDNRSQGDSVSDFEAHLQGYSDPSDLIGLVIEFLHVSTSDYAGGCLPQKLLARLEQELRQRKGPTPTCRLSEWYVRFQQLDIGMSGSSSSMMAQSLLHFPPTTNSRISHGHDVISCERPKDQTDATTNTQRASGSLEKTIRAMGNPAGHIASSLPEQHHRSNDTSCAAARLEKTRLRSLPKTPREYMRCSLELMMTHWNLKKTHTCCQFHAYCIVARDLISNMCREACMPEFMPLAGWQCVQCLCMNHQEATVCQVCQEKRDSPECSPDDFFADCSGDAEGAPTSTSQSSSS